MYLETWYKVRCPNCSASNWLCDGDMSDETCPHLEGFECWHCRQKYVLHEREYWEQEEGYHYDKGRKSPL